MLNEERKRIILNITNERKSVSVSDLMELLDASESTIRRDLADMDKNGLLKRVHGGAISLENSIQTEDKSVSERSVLNTKVKDEIGKYAASLIKDSDVVYLDAGTTTACIIPYLKNSKATFITNCVSHAKQLSLDGHQVYLPGGMLKAKTEAIIGGVAYQYIEKMNFTIGFFGTNGVSFYEGYSTPDPQEAQIKEVAFNHSNEKYVLCDPSKFNKVCTATFAKIDKGFLITNSEAPDEYKVLPNSIIIDLLEY
ncbi:MAG: DeoR/GlpR family DNA-binding transcription regulator [Erysipelotrichaceae bacterium]|nr:DeoR/GlpR family DNA-binding transcription regulator [Erysipelotrichaceae bacterium]